MYVNLVSAKLFCLKLAVIHFLFKPLACANLRVTFFKHQKGYLLYNRKYKVINIKSSVS
jgi:hypothetical protein